MHPAHVAMTIPPIEEITACPATAPKIAGNRRNISKPLAAGKTNNATDITAPTV